MRKFIAGVLAASVIFVAPVAMAGEAGSGDFEVVTQSQGRDVFRVAFTRDGEKRVAGPTFSFVEARHIFTVIDNRDGTRNERVQVLSPRGTWQDFGQ